MSRKPFHQLSKKEVKERLCDLHYAWVVENMDYHLTSLKDRPASADALAGIDPKWTGSKE